MSSFEFLSVFISVVVGLGMANLLTGIGRLLHRHKQVRLSAAMLIWTAYVFMFMVIYWWTVVFGWQEWQNWNIVLFLFVLSYGVVLFLMSAILYPIDGPDTWDMHEHFMSMRHWFFGSFIILVLIEIVDTTLKDHLDDFSIPYFIMIATWLINAVIGWVSTNRRTQTIIAAYQLVSVVAWVTYQLRDLEWVLE